MSAHTNTQQHLRYLHLLQQQQQLQLVSVTPLHSLGYKQNRTQLQRRSSRSNPEQRHFVSPLLFLILLSLLPPARARPDPLALPVAAATHSTSREGAWLPSRLWSSGAGCSVKATEMWPSPTWPPRSGTDWRFARSYTSTDRTWCEYWSLNWRLKAGKLLLAVMIALFLEQPRLLLLFPKVFSLGLSVFECDIYIFLL